MKGRVAITTADIVRIKGCSLRTAQWQLQRIRVLLGRKRNQVVFVSEYADAENIPLELLQAILEKHS